MTTAVSQPTNDQLHAAWTNAINSEGYPGWQQEARRELQSLRDLRTTWTGDEYRNLRRGIDAYLSGEKP